MDTYVRQQFVAESRANVTELRGGLLRLDFDASVDAASLLEVLAVFAGNIVEMATICEVVPVGELSRAIELCLLSPAAVDSDTWPAINAATELLSRQLDAVETLQAPPSARASMRSLRDVTTKGHATAV